MNQPPPQWGHQQPPPPQVIYVQQPAPKSKKGFFAGCGTLIGAVLVLGLGFRLCSQGEAKLDAEKAAYDASPAVSVKAEEIAGAYIENALAADRMLLGRKLEVTGTVLGVDTGSIGQAVIRLRGRGPIEVHASGGDMTQLALNARAGDTLTMICKGAPRDGATPRLSHCGPKVTPSPSAQSAHPPGSGARSAAAGGPPARAPAPSAKQSPPPAGSASGGRAQPVDL